MFLFYEIFKNLQRQEIRYLDIFVGGVSELGANSIKIDVSFLKPTTIVNELIKKKWRTKPFELDIDASKWVIVMKKWQEKPSSPWSQDVLLEISGGKKSTYGYTRVDKFRTPARTMYAFDSSSLETQKPCSLLMMKVMDEQHTKELSNDGYKWLPFIKLL